MITLILGALEGLAKLGVGLYEDSKKSELERIAALQEWFQKGADSLVDLIAAHAQNVGQVEAAFAAARARLSVQELGAKFAAAVIGNEATKQP